MNPIVGVSHLQTTCKTASRGIRIKSFLTNFNYLDRRIKSVWRGSSDKFADTASGSQKRDSKLNSSSNFVGLHQRDLSEINHYLHCIRNRYFFENHFHFEFGGVPVLTEIDVVYDAFRWTHLVVAQIKYSYQEAHTFPPSQIRNA